MNAINLLKRHSTQNVLVNLSLGVMKGRSLLSIGMRWHKFNNYNSVISKYRSLYGYQSLINNLKVRNKNR